MRKKLYAIAFVHLKVAEPTWIHISQRLVFNLIFEMTFIEPPTFKILNFNILALNKEE